MCVHLVHDCRSRRTERALDTLELKIQVVCEPHVDNQIGSLHEQKVVLTIETSFLSHVSPSFKQNGMQRK